MTLLEVDDLHTSLLTSGGWLHAVDGVGFTLERGRTLAVVGESGCGKTTLVRSVMGLLPRDGVRRTGQVRLDGTDLVGADRPALRTLWGTRVAMVFQDPMTSLNPVVRIGRQITEKLVAHHGATRHEAGDEAVRLLASVGIPDPERCVRRHAHALSGGMRQRVMIAIALAGGPSLLLADEPTTALDVTVQAQILDLLRTLQRERDMAMVLVSHDLAVVAGCADEVAVMYAGRFVERAPTRAIFHAPRMPYTRALLGAIPRSTLPRHARLVAIPGRPPDLRVVTTGCPFLPRCDIAEARCADEAPPLRRVEPGHDVACWAVR